MMQSILWISRHELTPAQRAELERYCGGEFRLLHWQENVEDVAQLVPLLHEADVVAAVLPIHLLSRLVAVAGTKPVLIDMARRTLIPAGSGESGVVFAHGGWHRVERLELVLSPLLG